MSHKTVSYARLRQYFHVGRNYMRHQVLKTDIAISQLRAAVQLYNASNYISAITLAAASEEILAQIAKVASGTNSVIDDKIWIDQLADYLKQPRPSVEKLAKSRNKVKNELKHHDSGEDRSIEHDFRFEAETFILGAIRNFELIYGVMPKDRIIKRFWHWISM
jgi:hypothetical protein